jgi:hypothetical protein
MLVFGVLALLVLAGPARAHNVPGSRHNRVHAINYAFCHTLRPCSLGWQAVRVAECESHLWPYAHNGQYLGMFQMGSYARSTFGFSWSPWQQARDAFQYWSVSGWTPWTCA